MKQDPGRYFSCLTDIIFRPESPDEIELRRGDIIGLAGNHWDGYSKGRNHRTDLIGIYPSYKVREINRLADYPSWPDD